MVKRFLIAAAVAASTLAIGGAQPATATATETPASPRLVTDQPAKKDVTKPRCRWRERYGNWCRYCYRFGDWRLQYCRDTNGDHD